MKSWFSHFQALSKGQRAFLIALGVLVLLPFTVLTLLQTYSAANLAILSTKAVASERTWKDEAETLASDVDPASLATASQRYAYRLMMGHAAIMPERLAVISIEVPLGDMRAKKKALSPEALIDLAASRTQSLAEEECQRLLETLAADCAIMSAMGRPSGSQSYEYQFQLAFAEKAAFGATPPGRQTFVITKASPGRAAIGQRLYFERTGLQRDRIYRDIAATCMRIRKDAGNCSIANLSIAGRLDRGTPMIRLSASATYGSLVASTDVAENRH
ncbi:hypothetical protein [Rhizobium alvei]|uniref:Uncharacterized protein n=1 Tax=Rhizobium alvei TaxID=1132659 RepID=A0ABT8YKA0_9HYPH|nr:hypothetical protein [Rhizobium alvei]MDO6963729.1 hypothetical protein [Rhizobium alvei]